MRLTRMRFEAQTGGSARGASGRAPRRRLARSAARRGSPRSASSPVWKSNFRHPTPSTQYCLRSCVCSMAWSFHAIDAALSSLQPLLDGMERRGGLSHLYKVDEIV